MIQHQYLVILEERILLLNKLNFIMFYLTMLSEGMVGFRLKIDNTNFCCRRAPKPQQTNKWAMIQLDGSITVRYNNRSQ